MAKFKQVNVKISEKQHEILKRNHINVGSLSRELIKAKIDAEGWA